VRHALGSLGFDGVNQVFDGVNQVRQGKMIELDLAETDPTRATEQARAMCERLLANTVIESYALEPLEG